MNKVIYIFILLITIFGASCFYSADKELFGTYIRSVDSGRIYSKLILYPGNNYSFYSSSCLSANNDTGSFTFRNDTIHFKSYDKGGVKISKENKPLQRTLAGEKVIVQQKKLIYFRAVSLPKINNNKLDTITHTDTLVWIKDRYEN